MVQLPQRRRSAEDDVPDVSFDAYPRAPSRPASRADHTATPRATELRSSGELGGASTTSRLAGRLFGLFDTAGQMGVGAYDLRGAPVTLRRQVLADLTSAADRSTVIGATTVPAQNTAIEGLLDARSWPLYRSYDALGRCAASTPGSAGAGARSSPSRRAPNWGHPPPNQRRWDKGDYEVGARSALRRWASSPFAPIRPTRAARRVLRSAHPDRRPGVPSPPATTAA